MLTTTELEALTHKLVYGYEDLTESEWQHLEAERAKIHRYFIEKSVPGRDIDHETYEIVWSGDSYESGLAWLASIDSELRHGLWCKEWVNTECGYMPMAWIN